MRRTLSFPLVFLVPLVAVAVGCQKKNVPAPDAAGPAPAATHTGDPLTEADCLAFGRDLEKAVANGDTMAVERLLRFGDMVERSVSDFGLNTDEKKGLMLGVNTISGQMIADFIEPVKNGGSYTVLRTHTVDGRPRVLLRLLGPDGALNYHDFSLVRYADGQIATDDVYIYLSGEPFSQTLRRVLAGLLGEMKGRGKPEGPRTRHLQDLQSMVAQLRNGQAKEALATFRRLPAELQKDKVFRLLAIQAAQETNDDDEYITEIEAFRKDHPDDPAGDLVSLGYDILKKKYDEALKGLERLDKALGGDPYLGVMRAGVFVEAGKFKEAREAAEKAIADDPKLAPAYRGRVTIALRENNNADALTWLKKMAEATPEAVDADALKADPDFAGFVASPQFAQFKTWLAQRKK